jgi:serine/threonine protein phosphatase PrpC
MDNLFVVSSASVPGSHHRSMAKNNQDAWAVDKNEQALVAIVCDGCGSGAHSEVGAQLAGPFIVKTLLNKLAKAPADFEKNLEETRTELHCFLRQTATSLNESSAAAVLEYFLFTVVGVIITERQTVIFGLGDGLFALNGEVTQIDENNEPNYLAYGLLSEEKARQKFVIRKIIDTGAIQSLLIATDGLAEWEEVKNRKITICGREQMVGGIEQFFVEDKYKQNSTALQKRLNVIGLNHKLLADDATVILIRSCRDTLFCPRPEKGGENGCLS